MELYNFFSETVGKDKKDELYDIYLYLKDGCRSLELISFIDFSGEERNTLIGQIYGDDTNIGDLDLYNNFINIKYYWFNADSPQLNNLNQTS